MRRTVGASPWGAGYLSCTGTDVNFNYTATAGLYSQVAGVLAGFAFSAILLAITRNALRQDKKTLGRAVAAFLAAFFGLVLAAVQYAVMSGELIQPQRSGRLAIEEVLDGLAFGISILVLLYGVVLLLQADSRLELATIWAERVMATFGPVITLLLLLAGGQDIESVRQGRTSASLTCNSPGGWQLASYVVVFVGVCSLLLLRRLRDRLPSLSQDRQIVSSFVLTLAVAVSIAHSTISIVYDYRLIPPAYMSFALLAASAAALNVFSFLVLATRPDRVAPKSGRRGGTWQVPKARKGDRMPKEVSR